MEPEPGQAVFSWFSVGAPQGIGRPAICPGGGRAVLLNHGAQVQYWLSRGLQLGHQRFAFACLPIPDDPIVAISGLGFWPGNGHADDASAGGLGGFGPIKIHQMPGVDIYRGPWNLLHSDLVRALTLDGGRLLRRDDSPGKSCKGVLVDTK